MKKWQAAWIIFFLTGYMFFVNVDMQRQEYWMPYFVWDKSKDIIALLGFLAASKRRRGILLYVLCLLIFRLLWEPLSNLIGWNINDKRASNVFFCLLVLVYILIYLKESKWPKSK